MHWKAGPEYLAVHSWSTVKGFAGHTNPQLVVAALTARAGDKAQPVGVAAFR